MQYLAALIFGLISLTSISIAQDKIDIQKKIHLRADEKIIAGDELRKMWERSSSAPGIANSEILKRIVINKGPELFSDSIFSEQIFKGVNLHYSYAIDAFLIMDEVVGDKKVYWIDAEAAVKTIGYEYTASSREKFATLFVERAGMAQAIVEQVRSDNSLFRRLIAASQTAGNADVVLARMLTAIAGRDKFVKTGCLRPILQYIDSRRSEIARNTSVSENLVESLRPTIPGQFREGTVMMFDDNITGRYHYMVKYDASVPGCAPKGAGFMFSIWPY